MIGAHNATVRSTTSLSAIALLPDDTLDSIQLNQSALRSHLALLIVSNFLLTVIFGFERVLVAALSVLKPHKVPITVIPVVLGYSL